MITIGNPIYETILQYVEKGGRMAEMLFDGIMTNKIVDVEIHSHEHTENKGGELRLDSITFCVTFELPNGDRDSIKYDSENLSQHDFNNLPSEIMFDRLKHSKEYIKYLANKTQLAQKDRALEESHKALEDKDKELEKLRLLLAQHGISD